MTTITFALATSLFFGCSDFLGGMAARRDSALIVTVLSHLVGGLLLVPLILVLPVALWGLPDLAWGAVAGIGGGIGVAALYGALAVGRMSVVAPVTAALSGALPAAFDMLRGNPVGPLTITGMALAILAVVLVSAFPEEEMEAEMGVVYRPTRSLLLSLLSGTGFAIGITALALTSPASGLWPLLAARVVSVLFIGSITLLVRGHLRIARPAVTPTLSAGVLDMTANYTLITAIRMGPLSIAAVFGSLYPVVVVLLARIVLHERLRPLQWFGAMLAMVAVLLTAIPA